MTSGTTAKGRPSGRPFCVFAAFGGRRSDLGEAGNVRLEEVQDHAVLANRFVRV